MTPRAAEAITWAVFAVTYAGLAFGRWPGLRTNRAGIALVGATAALVLGLVTFDDAVGTGSVDYPTLALLFGMMIVVGFLRTAGLFGLATRWAGGRIGTPRGLLALTVAVSGGLSAFLINDVVCVALTPVVLRLARRRGFDPVPHLIALAAAANIGSAGTITGNPQNVFIGSHSGIAYLRFAAKLLPVSAAGLLLTYAAVALIYRGRLRGRAGSDEVETPDAEPRTPGGPAHRRLRFKSVAVTLAAIAGFCAGLPLEVVALAAASAMLLGRVRPDKAFARVDWQMLVMFFGLFVVVHAFRLHVVSGWDVGGWAWLTSRPVDLLSLVSAALSNLVSNVPAVLLLEPVLEAIPRPADREAGWLALAMSSTFAGNLTILGSVANLIVVENASRAGVRVSFWDYSKVGIPLTILTLLLGVAWLKFVPY